jgi:hypothetical protein
LDLLPDAVSRIIRKSRSPVFATVALAVDDLAAVQVDVLFLLTHSGVLVDSLSDGAARSRTPSRARW